MVLQFFIHSGEKGAILISSIGIAHVITIFNRKEKEKEVKYIITDKVGAIFLAGKWKYGLTKRKISFLLNNFSIKLCITKDNINLECMIIMIMFLRKNHYYLILAQ